ncbi:hypothetical protein [Candidatus Uabimicrobium sp. HlEnr_7]|uniref:hypothetical protein n=1 Tax=Candidatus Uabimicrobium helgolandensis TaxID=3095367 RepID=UPI003555BF09
MFKDMLLVFLFALSLGFLVLYTPFIIVWFIVDKPPQEAIFLYYANAGVVFISYFLMNLFVRPTEATTSEDESAYNRVFRIPKRYKIPFFNATTLFLLFSCVTVTVNNYFETIPIIIVILCWHFWRIDKKNKLRKIFSNQRIGLNDNGVTDLETQKFVAWESIGLMDNHKQEHMEVFDQNTCIKISHCIENLYFLRNTIENVIEQRRLLSIKNEVAFDLPQKRIVGWSFVKTILMLGGIVGLLYAIIPSEEYLGMASVAFFALLLLLMLFTTPLVIILSEKHIILWTLLGKKKILWAEVEKIEINNTYDDEKYCFDLYISETKSYSLREFEDGMELYKMMKSLLSTYGKYNSEEVKENGTL